MVEEATSLKAAFVFSVAESNGIKPKHFQWGCSSGTGDDRWQGGIWAQLIMTFWLSELTLGSLLDHVLCNVPSFPPISGLDSVFSTLYVGCDFPYSNHCLRTTCRRLEDELVTIHAAVCLSNEVFQSLVGNQSDMNPIRSERLERHLVAKDEVQSERPRMLGGTGLQRRARAIQQEMRPPTDEISRRLIRDRNRFRYPSSLSA